MQIMIGGDWKLSKANLTTTGAERLTRVTELINELDNLWNGEMEEWKQAT